MFANLKLKELTVLLDFIASVESLEIKMPLYAQWVHTALQDLMSQENVYQESIKIKLANQLV